MKIEISLDGRVVSTQWNIDPRTMPNLLEAKKAALRAAIDNNELRISQAFRANIDLMDDAPQGGAASLAVNPDKAKPAAPKSVISFWK
ncbi:MAG: hypothetical protein ABI398_09480 [Devosia sp.]